MANASDISLFLDPLHRSIGRVCSEESLGAYAIARELGLPTKKIASPLKTMCKAKVLECEGSEGKAAKLYRLRQGLLEALLEAAAEARDPGLLRGGQILLAVEANDPNSVLRALSTADVADVLSWSARVSGSGVAYLLAFESSAGMLPVDGAIDRLASTGATVRTMAVSDVVGVEEFVERGKMMRQRERSRRPVQAKTG
jgi:hypothetical protein